MLLRAVLPRVSPRLHRPQLTALLSRRPYSDKPSKGPAFPVDPLIADVLAEEPDQRRRGLKPKVKESLPKASEQLPPLDQWRKYFPSSPAINHRVSLRNPESAHQIADAFVPNGSRDKVIIEAFPGPGQLTRALLQLPKERIRKIIVLEVHPQYLEYLKPLEADPRVKVLSLDGYVWESYDTIHDLGLLNDVEKNQWTNGVHPHLHFISHLPSSIVGEQLIAQLFRGIPDHQWLFQYGRVPLSFLLSEYVWKRVSGDIDSQNMRCKLSVMAEATAECREAVPFESLQPYEDHFHPVRTTWHLMNERRPNNRRVGNPFQAINVIPLEYPAIQKGQLDEWDYCVRRLFVKKATGLKSALSSLAPGAQVLLSGISDPALPADERIDVKKLVRKMTIQDWSILLKAFHEWPFKPEDLSIDTHFGVKEF